MQKYINSKSLDSTNFKQKSNTVMINSTNLVIILLIGFMALLYLYIPELGGTTDAADVTQLESALYGTTESMGNIQSLNKCSSIQLTVSSVKATESATTVAEEESPKYELTDDERRMIMFVADSEDNTSVESRQGVMQVIMNRIESDKFPGQDSVQDVLYAPKQFNVMKKYNDNYIPSDEAIEALERLLYESDIFTQGGAQPGECAIFFAAKYVNPARIAKRLYLVAEIDGSRFYGQK